MDGRGKESGKWDKWGHREECMGKRRPGILRTFFNLHEIQAKNKEEVKD